MLKIINSTALIRTELVVNIRNSLLINFIIPDIESTKVNSTRINVPTDDTTIYKCCHLAQITIISFVRLEANFESIDCKIRVFCLRLRNY